jgi:hypothetical protein
MNRCLILITLSVLLTALAVADAGAIHKDPTDFHNDYPVLQGPSVSAQQVEEALKTDNGVNLASTKVEGDLELPRGGFESLAANDTVFAGDLTLGECEDCPAKPDKTTLYFEDSDFEGKVDFYFYDPESLQFIDCRFKQKATFHSLNSPKFKLNGSIFDSDAIFTAMDVVELGLWEVHFKDSADFAGAQIASVNTFRLRADEPIYIRWSQLGDRWVEEALGWATSADVEERLPQYESQLMFWKNNFVELGYVSDARSVNYEIIKYRSEYLMGWPGWTATTVLGFASAFGTKPFRPFWISALAIIIFGVIYGASNRSFSLKEGKSSESNQPHIGFALLYSLDTFIPFVTVTDVREQEWKISDSHQWLELIEQLLGFALFSAAAYSITSYVI